MGFSAVGAEEAEPARYAFIPVVEPLAVAVTEVPRPLEPVVEVVVPEVLPEAEPELPPVEPTPFEAPARAAQVEQDRSPHEPVAPWIRVRPAPPEPTEDEPVVDVVPASTSTVEAAYVEAALRDEGNKPPVYPRSSVTRGEEGEVLLRLSIDASGKVIDVQLESGCGHPRLHRAAIRAARDWSFEPARRGGEAVASERTFPIEFRIRS